MKNKYEIRGDVVAVKINSLKYGNCEAIISMESLDRVNEFPNTWVVQWSKTTKNFYVMGRSVLTGRVYLHRWITRSIGQVEVDHINHNTLDNRLINLRVVTKSQNMRNQKGLRSDNTSGVRGVYWYRPLKKWKAVFMVNKKSKHVGYFDDIESAKHALYKAMEVG